MAKFRAVPLPQSEDEFIRGAEAPAPAQSAVPTPIAGPTPASIAGPTPAPMADAAATEPPGGALPWYGLDPRARPTVNQTVRLNAYQHAQLQYLAQTQERSLSQVLRRILGPALDRAARDATES
jgi:hypothetical protein